MSAPGPIASAEAAAAKSDSGATGAAGGDAGSAGGRSVAGVGSVAGLMRLADSPRSYEFIPAAMAALVSGELAAPVGAALRVNLAAHLLRLGLVTPAHEQLDALAVDLKRDPGLLKAADAALFARLRGDVTVAATRADLITRDQRRARLHASLVEIRRVEGGASPGEAVGANSQAEGVPWPAGVAPALEAPGWASDPTQQAGAVRAIVVAAMAAGAGPHAAVQAFRTLDGSVVTRLAGEGGVGGVATPWVRFDDQSSRVRALALPPGANAADLRPFYVQGCSPATLLLRLNDLLPPRADGGVVPIVLIVERPEAIAEAIGELADDELARRFAAWLCSPRVRLVLGPGAPERLRAVLAERRVYQLGGFATVLEPLSGFSLERELDEATRQQAALQARLAGQIEAGYAARLSGEGGVCGGAGAGGEWGGGPGKRTVLLPTTRYSTYVQHAARDLAGGLVDAGCDARLLIEPDSCTVLSAAGTMSAVARWMPDATVVINYTRKQLPHAAHIGRPLVTWVQDPMPHLFDPASAAAMGPRDVLAGHLHPALLATAESGGAGYRRDRTLPLLVLASTAKFHPGPISAALAERFGCEIACVTRHSETPEAMRDRLVAENGDAPVLRALIHDAYEAAWTVARAARCGPGKSESVHGRLDGLTEQLLSRHLPGTPAPAVLRATFRHAILGALCDRALRHQTLDWAASIAERRGWRLAIFGRGWEKHPTLGRFARGELAHGEELRAAYQAAAVHLHASAATYRHQRVLECALSGGLPLARLREDDLMDLCAWVESAIAETSPTYMVGPDTPTRRDFVEVSDHPVAAQATAMLQRLGEPTTHFWFVHPTRQARPWGEAGTREAPALAQLLWPMDQTMFWSEATLERAVERAVGEPETRRALSEMIAARVRDEGACLTYQAAARRLLGMIG